MIIRIDGADDARISAYVNFRERDSVRNKRQFIAEGKTVLQALLTQKRFTVQSLLVSENRLEGIRHIVDALGNDVPTYVATKAVLSQIAGFDMHRGVLGLANAPTDIKHLPDNIAAWKSVVLLSGLSNHDNVGAIFRNCAAFNVDAVLLDKQTCDPLYRKAIRVSVGGVFKVPFYEVDDIATAAERLNDHGFMAIALSPHGETKLNDLSRVAKTALILGTEGDGLDTKVINQFKSVCVEMNDDFDSLNVATTSGIVLHHLYTQTG